MRTYLHVSLELRTSLLNIFFYSYEFVQKGHFSVSQFLFSSVQHIFAFKFLTFMALPSLSLKLLPRHPLFFLSGSHSRVPLFHRSSPFFILSSMIIYSGVPWFSQFLHLQLKLVFTLCVMLC